MKRTKEQKAITLIALIITIVVLMILAAVAISSIQNDGMIGHAQNATDKYKQEQQKEQDMLNYYELVLSGKAWTQNGTTVSRGTDTFDVGDSIKIKTAEGNKTYKELGYDGENASYTGEWVVLGAEYGKLLLVSASNVQSSVALGGAKGGNINGTQCVGGYYNGASVLDDICDDYLNKTYADSARSIKVEDINRVTGYVPSAGTPVIITQESVVNEGPGVFMHPDGREIGKNGVESIKETNTSYIYDVSPSMTDGPDTWYDALFGRGYWLASTHVEAYSGGATFNFMFAGETMVVFDWMWNSEFGETNSEHGACAVITLKADVQVVEA